MTSATAGVEWRKAGGWKTFSALHSTPPTSCKPQLFGTWNSEPGSVSRRCSRSTNSAGPTVKLEAYGGSIADTPEPIRGGSSPVGIDANPGFEIARARPSSGIRPRPLDAVRDTSSPRRRGQYRPQGIVNGKSSRPPRRTRRSTERGQAAPRRRQPDRYVGRRTPSPAPTAATAFPDLSPGETTPSWPRGCPISRVAARLAVVNGGGGDRSGRSSCPSAEDPGISRVIVGRCGTPVAERRSGLRTATTARWPIAESRPTHGLYGPILDGAGITQLTPGNYTRRASKRRLPRQRHRGDPRRAGLTGQDIDLYARPAGRARHRHRRLYGATVAGRR